MRTHSKLLALGSFLFLIVNISTADCDSPKSISELQTCWTQQWNAANLDGVMKLYAPNATLIRSETTTIGSAAIRTVWKSLMDAVSIQFAPSTLPAIEKSDLGYEIGGYQENIVPKDKKTQPSIVRGEFLIIAEKTGKKWAIVVQNFTTQQPQPPAPATGMFADNRR